MFPMTKPPRRASARCDALPAWSAEFLGALAETSNVTAAAKRAGIATSTAYDARRASAAFNRVWQKALCEGYDNLELELLDRLRKGEVKPASGARRGTRSYDNATAFRLLVAHRESAARQRAVRDDEDTEAILLSINAKLETIRLRKRTVTEAAAPESDNGAE